VIQIVFKQITVPSKVCVVQSISCVSCKWCWTSYQRLLFSRVKNLSSFVNVPQICTTFGFMLLQRCLLKFQLCCLYLLFS